VEVQDEQNKDILISWKEIADYLDCDVRTCQRWEKKSGLPVHRFIDSSKSRVFSYKQELDAWLEREVQRETKKRWRYLFFLAPAIALVLIFVLSMKPKKPKEPHDFRIEGSELVILTKNQKELWRFDTQIRGLQNEAYYRDHFQFKKSDGEKRRMNLPLIMIKDVDRDGRKEVLFAQTPVDLNYAPSRLFCLSSKGEIKWIFVPGRAMFFGEKQYSSKYSIYGFKVIDFNKDRPSEILVISDNRDMFPTQMTVLDGQGNSLREYWNSGRIEDISFCDLDLDGEEEILLAGCNNEYNSGCLIVLESDFASGGSPQTGYYKSPGLTQGVERRYTLIPSTDIGNSAFMRDPGYRIHIVDGKTISFESKSGLYFEFDFDLELKEIRFADQFEALYSEAYEKGMVNSPFSEKTMAEFKSELIPRVLYYTGEDWACNPLMDDNKSSAQEQSH
jgi:hypothetical protein